MADSGLKMAKFGSKVAESRSKVAKLEPKEAKRAAVAWFNKADKVPNSHEMLFLALLVVRCATDVSKLKLWAADIVRREASFQQRGSAALPLEFRDNLDLTK